jgi:hypothetical protein
MCIWVGMCEYKATPTDLNLTWAGEILLEIKIVRNFISVGTVYKFCTLRPSVLKISFR